MFAFLRPSARHLHPVLAVGRWRLTFDVWLGPRGPGPCMLTEVICFKTTFYVTLLRLKPFALFCAPMGPTFVNQVFVEFKFLAPIEGCWIGAISIIFLISFVVFVIMWQQRGLNICCMRSAEARAVGRVFSITSWATEYDVTIFYHICYWILCKWL